MRTFLLAGLFLSFAFGVNLFAEVYDAPPCYIVRVVDRETHRGIPMVELTTTSKLKYYTDSNGIICFDEPSLLNQEVYFEVFSHGYENFKKGVRLRTNPGTTVTLELQRLNIAERIYRITGQNIYGESAKAGLSIPIQRQGLNGKVTGQDTFIETLYKGKVYWFWGDTFGPASFNGHVSGAVSGLPAENGLPPETGIDLIYFVDSTGLNKPMCDIPGSGLVWIDWLVTLPDENGTERLLAKYTRVKDLEVAYERGIALFDDSSSVFRTIKQIDEWLDKTHSSGHPVQVNSNGQHYFYIFDRYGLERVPADYHNIQNQHNYERFTCLKQGNKTNGVLNVERDKEKNVLYSWRSGTDAVSPKQQEQLINSGLLAEDERWFYPLDIISGKKLELDPASVFWNDYRKRWIMLAYEFCGQVWFLEADTPTGPWVYGRKIVTHDNYDFYNVGQHPLFDQDGGRVIYFEGTYTSGFSGNPYPTPLYDYNQMMYRLAMDDERLLLPVPVYYLTNSNENPSYLTRAAVDSLKQWEAVQEISFFALPKNKGLDGVVPIYLEKGNNNHRMISNIRKEERSTETPLFYALPNELTDGLLELFSPLTVVPLYEYQMADETYFYSTHADLHTGKRSEIPICRVWRNPTSVLALDVTAMPVLNNTAE